MRLLLPNIKSYLFLLMLLTTTAAQAQKSWHLTLQAGPSLAYNGKLQAERPIPQGLKPFLGLGASFGAELEYRWHEQWGVAASVRSANIKRGFRSSSTSYDSVNQQINSSSGFQYTQTSPAHISLMLFRHSKPFWRERFTTSAGIGAAGIVVRNFGSDQQLYASDEPGNEYQATFTGTSATSLGFSVTGHLALNYHLNQRDAFSLRLLHYQGLSTLYTLTDEQFQYQGEQFRVQSRTNGSYTAMQLGYTRRLGRSARPERTRWVPDPAELARTEFYLGFEIGPKTDYFTHTENGPYMENRPLLNGTWGVVAGVGWKERHQLETGLYRNYISQTVYIEVPFVEVGKYSSWSAYEAWQIPLRYRHRLPLVRHRLYLVPSAGVVAMAGIPKGGGLSGRGGAGAGTVGDTTFFSSVSYEFNTWHERKASLALEAGLGLEARLMKRAAVRFSARYQQGLATISRMDVEYIPLGEGPYQGTILSKGSMMQYLLGVSMPLYRMALARSEAQM